jgi:antirestriction protein
MPKIYVASLSDYNAGYLHGTWIDADQDPEEIHAEIQAMLEESKELIAEEWAIHDTDGFDGLKISEHESIETVSKIATLLNDFPSCVISLADDHTDPSEDLREWIEEHYQGEYTSLEDWAAEWLGDSGELTKIPENLQYYFDFKAYARDQELNGYIASVEENFDKVHVFFTN